MERLKKLIFGGAARPSVALPEELAAMVARYQERPPVALEMAYQDVRFVVLDISTTGLKVGEDHITGIAAVGVSQCMISPDDALVIDVAEAQGHHGFALERQLANLLAFIGDSPVVAYPAPFVAAFLHDPLKALLGVDFKPAWLDLALILPELFRESIAKQVPVDDWLHLFEIEVDGRHDALVDAVAEAKILQIALARAGQKDLHTLNDLLGLEKARHWLRPGG